MKFEIWPLCFRKRKNWDFKLAVNGKCSRPNFGTVSHIHFKLGTGVDYLSGITWHDSKVKMSKFKVTTSRNVPVENEITRYWEVVSRSYLGVNMRTTQIVGHRMVAIATPVSLATGPWILQFMAAYFKNAKSINFKISMSSRPCDPILVSVYMFTASPRWHGQNCVN